MPDKKKSNHLFLPVLDFTSNSLYVNASGKLPLKSHEHYEYYGFDQLLDNSHNFTPPHKIHRSWCGSKKDRSCNCRPEANLGQKALVRIECTAEHLNPIVDIVAEVQNLGMTSLAIDILECLSYQRSLPAKERSLTLAYPVLSTEWNRKAGKKTYIQTKEKKVDELLEIKIKELKQLVRPTPESQVNQSEIKSSDSGNEKNAIDELSKGGTDLLKAQAVAGVEEPPKSLDCVETKTEKDPTPTKQVEEVVQNGPSTTLPVHEEGTGVAATGGETSVKKMGMKTSSKIKSKSHRGDKSASGKARFSKDSQKITGDHDDMTNLTDLAAKLNSKKQEKMVRFGIQLIEPPKLSTKALQCMGARVSSSGVKPPNPIREITKTGLSLAIPANPSKRHRPYFPSQNVYGKHNQIYRPTFKTIVNTVYSLQEQTN